MVLGAEGGMEVGVRDDKGIVVKAEVADDGTLQPALDKKGKTTKVVGPDGKQAEEIKKVAPVVDEVIVDLPVVVTGPDGQPKIAVLDAAGYPVEVCVRTVFAGCWCHVMI